MAAPLIPRFSAGIGGTVLSPGPVRTPSPIANPIGRVPVAVKGNQFGLNSLPTSPRYGGLPSPSVGSVVAQTGLVPLPVLSGLPFASPNVSSSFGMPAYTGSVPPRGGPQQNFIGERT